MLTTIETHGLSKVDWRLGSAYAMQRPGPRLEDDDIVHIEVVLTPQHINGVAGTPQSKRAGPPLEVHRPSMQESRARQRHTP